MKITNKIISEIGVREKYLRDNHYNTLKVWWARRPIMAMRALLINEIQQRKGIQTVDENLISQLNPPSKSFDQFQKRFGTSELNVLDVFSGGGSIPFESSRLGFKSFSSELNPVATLLQKTIFNSLKVDDYGDLMYQSGMEVIERLYQRFNRLYQFENIDPYVLFWTKTCSCKKCEEEIDLRRIRYFSKKSKRKISLDGTQGDYSIGSSDYDRTKTKGFKCNNCGTINTFSDIKDFCKSKSLGTRPLALCFYKEKKKTYKVFDENLTLQLENNNNYIQRELDRMKYLIPRDRVKSKGGVINPTLYDLKFPGDYFNDRQRVVLLGLIEELIHQYEIDVEKFGINKAKQILLGLTSLIEFQVDWNSNSTMWISQNEQTGRSLAGPGVGMKWDYIEINPFFHMGSNFQSKLNRVSKTYKTIGNLDEINIINGTSAKLPINENTIDIILTDPPYFDSVDYTGLSEFFRPWFEVLIRNTYDKGISLLNDISKEAIVELTNKKSLSYRSQDHYQQVMTDVLSESNRVLKKDGTILMLYSHKTFEGWKVISESISQSGLKIESCIPLEMERIARPRAMNYQALNGVIVFRMKKSSKGISSALDDVDLIFDMMNQGNLQESQLVIYLAALSCKLSNLEGTSFEESYEKLIQQYEKDRITKWKTVELDDVTTTFLKKKLDLNLTDNEKSTLVSFDLLTGNKLKPLQDINPLILPEKCLLETAIKLFLKYENNSSTKIDLNSLEIQKLNFFFSVLGGLRLNTLKNRSSKSEKKVSRLILSKLSEV